VQLNPQDMDRRGLKDGDLVHVTSKRGAIVLPVQGSRTVQPTQAFIAMHWGPEYLSGRSSQGEPLAGVNALTTSAYCPTSKQPELKHAAVKILKAELRWTLLGVAWLPEASALTALAELRTMMPAFDFASCVPFSNGAPLESARGRERTGVLFRAAAHEAPEPALVGRMEALLGLATSDTLRYADQGRQQRRSARLLRTGDEITLDAFLLAGDTSAESWIKTLLQDELPAGRYGRLLLMPGAAAPLAVVAKSPQVCTCFNVGEDAIRGALPHWSGTEDQRLAGLQSELQCGTNCGSCIPELRRLVKTVPAALVALA
jgi:assimilatory nitrate reductase catalytic subunit